MSTTKLLPCPFCGGPVELERCRDTHDRIMGTRKWWGVKCRNTENRGGSCAIEQIPSASEEAAVARWNMRAPAGEIERKAALYDHMLAVAQANGYASITEAIAVAKKEGA